MKKLIFIALAMLLSVGIVDVSAQNVLKKLSKGIQKEVEGRVKKEVKKHKKSNKKNDNKQVKKQKTQSKETVKNTKPTKSVTPQVQTIPAIIAYGPLSGNINKHEWVDMGLPSGTRWATCNVGATAPEQPGKHYAWGETVVKKSYTEKNAKNNRKAVADFSGNKVNDVATANWGAGWRMPTKEEFAELVHYCNWRYVQKGGRWGAEISSRITKNTIFLPATGLKDGTTHHEASGCGMYWTSTPYESQTNNGAHEYHFGGALGEMGIAERYYGYAVRPVTDYDVNTEIPSSGEINGHKWVDLGLPSGLKWATCNVESKAVDQDGNYYNWGEISTYHEKDVAKNELDGKKMGDIGGNPRYDVARAKWGGTWRLPTEAEFKELIDNCTFEWTSLGRRSGMKVTSKINGNYIFLPASGGFSSSSRAYGRPLDINEKALYWTSTPARGEYSYDAYALRFYGTSYLIWSADRGIGCSVRPVSE